MKITLKVDISFQSWFEQERQPKSIQEWADFFQQNLFAETQVIGIDDDEFQDMVSIGSIDIQPLSEGSPA